METMIEIIENCISRKSDLTIILGSRLEYSGIPSKIENDRVYITTDSGAERRIAIKTIWHVELKRRELSVCDDDECGTVFYCLHCFQPMLNPFDEAKNLIELSHHKWQADCPYCGETIIMRRED